MSKTEIGKIYETKDYAMFKTLEGNRTDGERRAKKIEESIKKNGYIMSPLAINEKNEVIDGQGRLIALKNLDLPVHYYYVVGAGIDDCIAMNIYGEKWKISDYIDSYANRGNDNYIRLKSLIQEFKIIPAGIVMKATNHKSVHPDKTGVNKAIMEGTYSLSKIDEVNARKALHLLIRAWESIKKIQGRTDLTAGAFIWLVSYEKGLDIEKLINRIELMACDIMPIAKTEMALKEFERIYNYKTRSEKKYFVTDYDKFMRDQYGWYGKLYGDKLDNPSNKT